MKLPLFCYTCDMITGHESVSPIKARCRKCGVERGIPIHRWILVIVGVIALMGLSIWWAFQAINLVL
jgi:hypothetical protein